MEKMYFLTNALCKQKTKMDQIVVNLKIKKIKFLDTATSKQMTTEMKSSLKENHIDA